MLLRRRDLLVFAASLPVAPSGRARAQGAAPEASIEVDGRAAPQHLMRAKLRFAVKPGPFTLVYPKWLPGEHGPTGRIEDLVGIVITAGGKRLAWQRDAEDMYAITCEVPAGVSAVDVALEYVAGVGGRGDSLPSVASQTLWILKWNHILLYPKGVDPKVYRFAPSVKLPPAWTCASALSEAGRSAEGVRFAPVSLETLVDSPLAAGAFARTIDLSPPGGPTHDLALFADSPEALAIKDLAVAGFKQLVVEARALFGGWPYRRYRFLLSLSNHVPHGGLEHHESSDNRVPERTLLEEAAFTARAGLLPHEHVHAWNGKLRRPAGLATRDYQEPMKTSLLWIYEGLTTYLGELLSARSGLRSADEAREMLAYTAAVLDARVGRQWRPLVDTATSAPMLGGAPRAWRGWRRGLDYYPEAQLVWLEADALIRQRTQGARSFDDFCSKFFGAHARGVPAVVPYQLDEVVKTLNEVCPLDWARFFRERIDAVTPRAPVGGIDLAGWRLVYRETPSGYQRRIEQAGKEIDHSFSLGIVLREDGGIVDVLPGTPAAKAGIAPSGVVIAVGGRKLSRDRLLAALAASKRSGAVDLLVESQETYKLHRLAWNGGARFPALERVTGKPDLLAAMWARRAGGPGVPPGPKAGTGQGNGPGTPPPTTTPPASEVGPGGKTN